MRDLAEALSNVPGVSIDSGVTKTGGYGISIRGMGSGYTLILVDGKRINGDSELFPNAFSDSVTSFMPPMSAIERIEVIRGPASTLYGSDAIGGVVNIITKKSFDKWGASIGYDYTMQENKSFGNTQGFNFYTTGPLNEAKNIGLALRGRIYTRDFVPSTSLAKYPDVNNQGQSITATAGRSNLVGLAPANIFNIGSRLTWHSLANIGNQPKHNAYFDIDYAQQNYDNSQALLGNYGNNAADTTEELKQARNGYGASMDISRLNTILAYNGTYIDNPNALLSRLKFDTSLQYNITANPHRYVPTGTFSASAPTIDGLRTGNGVKAGDSRELRGEDIILDAKSNMLFNVASWFGVNTTLGARYWYNTFHDKLFQAAGGKATQEQHIGALFGEAEFMFIDKIFLTTGLRGNFNSIFGANASPRIYLAYNAIDEWLTFKGGVSTGYKTPSLSRLVSGVANLSGQGTTHTYGNPNLKPESSINYEFSAISDNEYLNISLTGFYTDFTNKIDNTGSVQNGQTINGFICGGTTCSAYVNVDKAKSYGAEVALGIKPISVGYGDVGLNAAYTYTKTEITKSGNVANVGTRLTNVPLHNLNASLNYDTRSFGFYIREEYKAGIYRGDPSVPNTMAATLGEFYKPIYLTHLGAYFKPLEHLRLNLAIYNLFDVDFVDYQRYTTNNALGYDYANAYNYIREGRRYYMSIQMEF
ncbi:TonB-dependent receptor [Helicobacter jaachi]|uniref:TonB-dependent receptor n=1 Tax=Helicobacter jaachi TaxID=1677920 RepID=A0A4U8TAJ7_9HELI|nr:TonB-dependent receptor [Helicobacter jaachi]